MKRMETAYMAGIIAAKGTLVGGVRVHNSSPFRTKDQAQSWLDTVTSINREAGRRIGVTEVSTVLVAADSIVDAS